MMGLLSRGRGPRRALEGPWPPPRGKAHCLDARVLTIHCCGHWRDVQGQEADEEGQTPGQSRRRHYIHDWGLGKGALDEGSRKRAQMSTHRVPLHPKAGWPCPSEGAQVCSPPRTAVRPQGLCSCRSLCPTHAHARPNVRGSATRMMPLLKGLSEQAQPLTQNWKNRLRQRKDLHPP